VAVRRAILNCYVLAFHKAQLFEAKPKLGDQGSIVLFIKRRSVQYAEHRHCRLLGARSKRPGRRTAEERDELAAFHSMTSSARS
jgi:hypothetical protein